MKTVRNLSYVLNAVALLLLVPAAVGRCGWAGEPTEVPWLLVPLFFLIVVMASVASLVVITKHHVARMGKKTFLRQLRRMILLLMNGIVAIFSSITVAVYVGAAVERDIHLYLISLPFELLLFPLAPMVFVANLLTISHLRWPGQSENGSP